MGQHHIAIFITMLYFYYSNRCYLLVFNINYHIDYIGACYLL